VLHEQVGEVQEEWDLFQILEEVHLELQELRNEQETIMDTVVAVEDREELLVLAWELPNNQMAEPLDPVPMAVRVLELLEPKYL
jgi:uncharacterized protein (DUF608 family)